MTDRNSDQPTPDSEAGFNPNDLDWLAFCYVADELVGTQRTDFEARLENDELAQQAVVDAVQQAQVLYSSLNSTSFNDGKEPVVLAAPPFQTQQGSFIRSRALIVTAAAMLMLVAGWAWFTSGNTTGIDTPAASESDRLAVVWVETLDVMSDAEIDEFMDEESPIADSKDEESDHWMLLALTDLEEYEGVDREAN